MEEQGFWSAYHEFMLLAILLACITSIDKKKEPIWETLDVVMNDGIKKGGV